MAVAFKLLREGDYLATVTAGGGRLRDIWHISGLALGQSRAQIVTQIVAHLQTLGWDQVKDGLPIAAVRVRKKPPGTAASAMVIYASGGFGGGGLPVAYSATDGHEDDHKVPVFFRTNGLWDERVAVVRRSVKLLIFNQRVQEGEYIGQRNEALNMQGLTRDFAGVGRYVLDKVNFVRRASNEIRANLVFAQSGPVRAYATGTLGNEVDVPPLLPLEEYERTESDGETAPVVGVVTVGSLYSEMPPGALSWVNFNA